MSSQKNRMIRVYEVSSVSAKLVYIEGKRKSTINLQDLVPYILLHTTYLLDPK